MVETTIVDGVSLEVAGPVIQFFSYFGLLRYGQECVNWE